MDSVAYVKHGANSYQCCMTPKNSAVPPPPGMESHATGVGLPNVALCRKSRTGDEKAGRHVEDASGRIVSGETSRLLSQPQAASRAVIATRREMPYEKIEAVVFGQMVPIWRQR